MLVPVLVIPVVSVWPYAVELMRMTVYGSSSAMFHQRHLHICNAKGACSTSEMIDEADIDSRFKPIL